jgi:hypothetical protein
MADRHCSAAERHGATEFSMSCRVVAAPGAHISIRTCKKNMAHACSCTETLVSDGPRNIAINLNSSGISEHTGCARRGRYCQTLFIFGSVNKRRISSSSNPDNLAAHSLTVAGTQFGISSAFIIEATSNQLDDPPLRVGVGFDVALGGRERGMSSQELHVPQRSANSANLPGGVGDEPTPSAVARAAVEAERPIPDGEQIHDRLRAGLPGYLSVVTTKGEARPRILAFFFVY